MAATLDQFLAALKAQESGGNYQARNPSGASGAYQFMPGTWANYQGYAEAYLAPPAVQDAKARQLAQSYYDRFGSWESVAKAWYAGPNFASRNQTVRQGGGKYPSINEYASQVVARMGDTVTTASTGGTRVVATRPTDKAGIRALQQQMKAAGFDPGPIDGIWGPRTQAAYDRYTAQQGGTAPAAAPTGQALEDKITSLAMTQHGGVLAPFVNDPEIRALLSRYVRGEIDDATLQGLVMQTNLWRTTTEAQRAWQSLETTDPATATSRVQAQATTFIAMARQQGFQLDPARADQLAREALRNGWTPQQIENAIGAEFQYNASMLQGQAADFRSQVDNLASSYFVPLSDEAKKNYVTWMVQGIVDEGWVENQMRNYAKSLFPTIAADIDKGVTVAQYAEPYRQIAANTLGVNPSSIDFVDPKWGAALNFVDTKTGERRPMTLDQWNQTLRSDERYGWRHTSGAKAEGYALVMNLAKAMGRIA